MSLFRVQSLFSSRDYSAVITVLPPALQLHIESPPPVFAVMDNKLTRDPNTADSRLYVGGLPEVVNRA